MENISKIIIGWGLSLNVVVITAATVGTFVYGA